MKLHIGCGEKYLPSYTHVDARKYPHIDYVTTVDDLHMIEDNSVNELYACHVLEHIGRHGIKSVLSEWNRVLKTTNGVLRIAVPNFSAIAEYYMENKQLAPLIGLLYGGQNYDYNHHHIAFDFETLKAVLEDTGFYDVQQYDWRTFLPSQVNGKPYDDFSRAYLPHMDFEHGKLMSLNVVARKK